MEFSGHSGHPVHTETFLMLLAAVLSSGLKHDTCPAITPSSDGFSYCEENMVGPGTPHQTWASSGHTDGLQNMADSVFLKLSRWQLSKHPLMNTMRSVWQNNLSIRSITSVFHNFETTISQVKNEFALSTSLHFFWDIYWIYERNWIIFT